MRDLTLSLLLLLAASSNAFAEQIVLPSSPEGLEGQKIHSESNALAGSLISSLAMTAASGGKAIFIPLPPLKEAKVLFQLATPGQTPDKADELLTITLHEDSGDTEGQATTDLVTALNKHCTDQPAQKFTAKNGITLVQRESLNCIRPGYLYSLTRFLKGKDGVYQIVYISRKKAPEGIDFELWVERLSQARVVQE